MNRRGNAGRTDSNHTAIVEALRAMRWLVKSTAAVGDGFPDLVALKEGRVVFLEVKDGSKPPSRRKLTPDEAVTHLAFRTHGVPILIVESIEDLAQLEAKG